MSSGQIIYLFNEGTPATRTPAIRGGKGASLATLVLDLNMPVPPGFTISTSVARAFAQNGKLPKRLAEQLHQALQTIERESGKRLGSVHNPLLVSVRSGAAVSMPGMMDTVLNVGLNDQTVEVIAKLYGETFAFDSYRRLLSMFAETVLGISKVEFSEALAATKDSVGVTEDWQLPSLALRALCEINKDIIAQSGKTFPQDPLEQLALCIFAVFGSWNSERAKAYRHSQNIPDWWGTAVTVQSMVYGNRNPQSGTGVVFSRDPATGEPGLYGNFARQAQGEDVVNGSTTPMPIASMHEWNLALYAELNAAVRTLENHCNDMVDVEFTVESGQLFILQWRTAKRTAQAAATFAVDGVWEGRWTRRKAIKLLSTDQIEQLHRRRFDPEGKKTAKPLMKGLPASPGAAVGVAVFSQQRAKQLAAEGLSVVLFRPDTSPDDLPGMLASAAIVTGRGGETSHAAVVARGLGIPAVVGCGYMSITGNAVTTDGGTTVIEGDVVSVDGATGEVFVGTLEFIAAAHSRKIKRFLSWLKRFGPKMPEPKLDFNRAREILNANTRLNDFYLLESMVAASKGNPSLHEEIEKLGRQVHVETAETITCYLAIAVAGELRHTVQPRVTLDSVQAVAWQRLQSNFNVVGNDSLDRGMAQGRAFDVLVRSSRSQQADFFQLAADVFSRNWTDGSFGGEAWAAIAQAPADFLAGRLSHTLYVDHVFDLEHNGGALFDKHRMIESDDRLLKKQLDTKKHASSIGQLFTELTKKHNRVSPEVLRLWHQGQSLGLW
ncbi:hypothetical protein BH10CYA1_BH10CYA1_18070 [soil metagenome]